MRTRKVRIVVQPAGERFGVPWPPVGDEMELPELEARDLTDLGYVESLSSSPLAKADDTPPAPRKRGRPRKGT